MMTKKDYELIARVFNKNYTQAKGGQFDRWTIPQVIKAQTLQMADVLKTENSKFDTAKFTKACGIDTDGVTLSNGHHLADPNGLLNED
jgi:hypothetical protein